YTMPWLEDFGTTGTTFPPTNWTRWSGLLTTEPVTLTTTTSGWLQDDFANIVTDPTNKSAKTNIYGTTWKYWLMTPPIQMPGAGYQLEFDIALTDYTNALPPDDPAGLSGVDDKFVVLISDGTSWSTANAVKVWDNDDLTTGGIYEVYNSVSHTGDHYVIPLDGYTGIKYIAFYGESTVSNADNDFFVDNVRIRLAGQAPDHVTLLTPEDQSTSVDPGNCILNWQNAVGGGEPGWYEIYVGTDLIDPGNDYYGEYLYETTNSNLDLSAQTDIDLGFNTTWYWAVLPYNDDGNPDPTSGLQVFRFTTLPDPTIVALPHEEYFDSVTAPDMAYGWTGYVNSTSTSAYVRTYSSTTYAQSPPNSVQMSNSADAAADLRLITPMIDLGRSLSQIKLKFYASSSSTGYPLLVGTVDVPDGTGTFNQIASISLTSTKTEYEVSYADYTGTDQYICFMHGLGGTYRSLYIDDVRLLELLPNDLAATAVSNPGIMTAGTAYDFTVDVYNEGTATQSAYTVKLMSVDARTELATLDVTTPLDPGASAQHILSWTPATGGVYEVYGKVVLTGDQNATNDDSPTTELYVLDNTMTVIPVGDDATTTSSTMLPVDMYYRNSVTEELYFTDEMHLQSGNITALVYKNTFLNERPDKAIKIWMAHTTVTDLSGGWLPTLDYTLVFDGTVDFPSGVNYVVIPLDTPFAYTGGTLATRFYRVFDSGALSSSDKFYYTTNPAHTVRSRYLRSDSTTYDPLAPSAAGTTLGYFPNTTFVVQNAVMQAGAVLNGYVYEAGGTTPVAGATVTIEDVRYSTTTDENGYYEFRFWEAHTVDAAVAKFGYYGATQASISLPLGTPVTQDFYLTPLPQASVSGTVTANDYPAGLEGATVSLFGYDDYEVQTGTGGAFSIADVYGNSAGEIYSVTVEKDGYTSYIGTLTVYESAVTGLSYNLVEYLWTPYNLVASHEGADARLNWDPAGLPDYQFYDFEADNGGFTHVDNPTPGWEWGTSSYSGAHSGTKVWGTVLEGNYANSAVYDLISPPSNLIPAGAFLTFWHFYRFEFYTTPSYYDGGIVQISTDGGTNWTTITPVGGYPCTSTSGLGSIQMYGGEQLTWTQANFDLSAYTNQTVMFKWKMLSESSVSREGWFVDDVFIGIPIAKTALQRFGASNDDRWFLNYDVYRFLAADEGTPGNWTQLDDDWADVTFLDTGFAALGEGSYKWAVKANYSGALESEAIISNALGIFITPPDVENGTIGATGNNVTIAWPAEPGASYYTVYGSNDPYAPDPWAILGYSATPSFTFDAGATAYKFFKITASDGEMPASKGVWPQLNK
ncbi:MAG TPA: choice-of-anchor J domain-containing protein, partial [Candidatus Syntrophosphaera sp.]|nr:choice-of-anchor J domain-containing protein [Candidatus Syntrophosphaera sp.]